MDMWADMDAMARGRGCVCTYSSNICRFLFYYVFDRIATGKFELRSMDAPRTDDQCERFSNAKAKPEGYIGMV